MALATILETLDDVPEALHAEYRETEVPSLGKRFVLDLTGIEAHPTVRNLKSAHDRVTADRNGLRTSLDTATSRLSGLPDDFDPADYLRLKEAEADGKGPKVDERLEAQRRELEKKRGDDARRFEGEIRARDERVAFLEGTVRRGAIDDGLARALAEAGVAKEYLGAARALLKDKGVIRLVEEGGVFRAVAETDALGEVPLAQFVTEWVGGDEGRPFVAKATGGGAQGGAGRPTVKNPFTREQWDVTAQGALVREKGQAAAESLAKAAGTTLGGPMPPARTPAAA